MGFWVEGSNGIRTKTKRKKSNRCTMLGPVVPLKKEESLISPLWRPNCLVTTNHTTRQRNFYLTNKKRKNGNSLTKRIGLSTLFLLHFLKWGTFHSMTDLSNKGSRGVSTCIFAQESRRKNSTSILTHWFQSCLIQRHSSLSLQPSTSLTTVMNAQ